MCVTPLKNTPTCCNTIVKSIFHNYWLYCTYFQHHSHKKNLPCRLFVTVSENFRYFLGFCHTFLATCYQRLMIPEGYFSSSLPFPLFSHSVCPSFRILSLTCSFPPLSVTCSFPPLLSLQFPFLPHYPSHAPFLPIIPTCSYPPLLLWHNN